MSWPKGVPNPYKGKKQPSIVDMETRLTRPGKNGAQWPILLGHGGTSILMYIALHPGCKWKEIAETVGINNNPTFGSRMQALRRRGLVAMLRNRYQINPAIKAHLREQLVRLLRALGRAYGMTAGEQTKTITGVWLPAKDRIELPDDLFNGEHRTKILALVAALGETYHYEASAALDIEYRHTVTVHHDLLREGVLRRRKAKNARLYSLDPDFPGAAHLEHLLRFMVSRSRRLSDLINYALLRRHQMRERGNLLQVGILDEMIRPTWKHAPYGVRMDVGIAAERLARRGEWNKGVWGHHDADEDIA